MAQSAVAPRRGSIQRQQGEEVLFFLLTLFPARTQIQRIPFPQHYRTLAEILIGKAEDGVQVNIMIWSEATSGDIVGEKGVCGTHDMETFNRFKSTKVRCALVPRELEVKEFTDVLQTSFAAGTYTHHQKTIVVDAENESSGSGARCGRKGILDLTHTESLAHLSFCRRLVAYIGGLDLTDGRYDTPEFPLFSTLLKEHRDDFYNGMAPTTTREQGPRQPWHDIHCRVEGQVANDIYINFSERWSRQVGGFF